ncbi:MAG: sensor domain-containing diguanylate cyclase [Pseudomonadales bacterium]|nr:sensor domain-containing diguanylate cyclase [Pseudomonadales bacterium]
MQTPHERDNIKVGQPEIDDLRLFSAEMDACFQRIVRLLASLLDVPIAVFSILGNDRQYIRTAQGLDIQDASSDMSLCESALLADDILMLGDVSEHPDFNQNTLLNGLSGIRFYAGIPVHGPGGQRIGILYGVDTRARKPDETLSSNLQDLRALLENEILLCSLVNEDHLTGLLNRRCFEQSIDQEWRRSARSLQPLALLYIDIDHFKAYNDTYGHLAGDECLQVLASIMKNACKRSADKVFRIGGEEFAILLPNTSQRDAVRLAQRLQSAVRQQEIPHESAPAGFISLSIGICALEATSGGQAELEAFINSCDKALYAAKERGRNTVIALPFEMEIGIPEKS